MKEFVKCSEGFGGIVIFKYTMDPQYSFTKYINIWINMGICHQIKNNYFIIGLEDLHRIYDYWYDCSSFDPFTPNRESYITREIIRFTRSVDEIIDINDRSNFHQEQMPEYVKLVDEHIQKSNKK